MSTFKDLQLQIMANKKVHGFNTTDVAKEFLFVYGEVAEAYDAWRKNQSDVGEELADVMIYTMGLAEILGIDLDREVSEKMDKNSKRKYINKGGVLIKEEKL